MMQNEPIKHDFETVQSEEKSNEELWKETDFSKLTDTPNWLIENRQNIRVVEFPASGDSQIENWNPQEVANETFENVTIKPNINFKDDLSSTSVQNDKSLEENQKLKELLLKIENLEKENQNLHEELRKNQESFSQSAIEFATFRQKNLAQVEKELLGLSVLIAESLIQREIHTDPSLHVSMAQAALKALGANSRVTLRASEQAYQSMLETFGSSEIEFEGVPVQIKVDSSIQGLGCIVENEFSQVDGRVHERLASILRSFQNQWKKNHEEGIT